MPSKKEYDLTGLRCPMPLVRLNQIMKELSDNDECIITADDPAFCPNLSAWCDKTGNELISLNEKSDTIIAVIRKKIHRGEGQK